jgi:hypothetical protein
MREVEGSRVIDKPQLIMSKPAGDSPEGTKTTVMLNTLNTVDAALAGIVAAPHDGERTVGEADASVDRVCVEVLTQLVKIRGAILFHTSPFRSQTLERCKRC